MPVLRTASWGPAWIAAFLLVFVIAGIGFIPRLGPQQDEALFTPVALEGQCGQGEGVKVAGVHVPLMLMSYVGALKGWLYKPLFAIWKPSVWSIRMPALLIAALAILVTSRVLALAAGPVAAIAVTALLASDASYLLTSVFDWGPVAIQHLLLASAAWFFLRFQRSASTRDLFGCAFCVGLALWNKTIAIWFLTGLAAGLLVCYRQSLRALLRPQNAFVFAGGIVLGAAPLIIYNVTSDWPTIRENAEMEIPDWSRRVLILRRTLNGSVVFGYLFPEAEGRESIANGIRTSLLPAAVFLAIPVGLALAARPTLFLVIAGSASWLFMAVSRGGGGAHHTILLWPLPHALVAIALARLFERPSRSWRYCGTAACAVAVLSGWLVIHRYRAAAASGGGGPGWTNAMFALALELDRFPDRWVILTDWGLHNNLCFLAPRSKFATLDPEPSAMSHAIAEADGIAIRSLGDQRFFPDSAAKLVDHAAKMGQRTRVAATIRDSRGEPKYEILDFY